MIELSTAEDVGREWRSHLSCGGAFVRGAVAEAQQECLLVLVGPGGAQLELPARAVFASGDGVGLEIDGFAAVKPRVEAWVEEVSSPPADELDPPTTRVARAATGMPMVKFSIGGPVPEPEPEPAPAAEPVAAAAPEPDDDDDRQEPAEDDEEMMRDPVARNVFERLRNLSVVQQLKVAREGEVHERMALERMYGKTVWEAILRNPRCTHPEVARIARMGALPRPMIELILGNTAWLRTPEVRRALLCNRRLSADMIPRILRLLPKHELRIVPNQTAYPAPVRDAARKLLKDA